MADISIDHIGEIFIIRATGTLSYTEIIAVAEQYGPQITHNLLWDLTAANSIDISTPQVHTLPSKIVDQMVKRKPASKTAIVVGSDYNFGVCSMYASYADIEELPYTIMVFRSNDSALDWLNEEVQLSN